MGRLLTVAPCPVCNYYIEGPLHFGGSNRSRLFIYHRYVLATCHDCRNLVSALIPTPHYDLPQVLQAAADDLARLEARVDRGDPVARRLLPLHRAALQAVDEEDEAVAESGVCTMCGSRNVTLLTHVGGDDGERFDGAFAWVDCPRCDEGRLMIQTAGHWDELDAE